MMMSVQQELSELGEPTDAASVNNLGATLLTLLSKFATNFQVSFHCATPMPRQTYLYNVHRHSLCQCQRIV
jgi:hypothetical protein